MAWRVTPFAPVYLLHAVADGRVHPCTRPSIMDTHPALRWLLWAIDSNILTANLEHYARCRTGLL
jgi:hypothetical protein